MQINSQRTTVSGQASTSGYSGDAGSMDYTQVGLKGQIIEGVISKVSDKISINFNGKEVVVPKSAVQDAKEGEIRSFQIKDVTKNSIVLKEVEKTSGSQPSIGVMQTKVGEDRNSFEKQLEKTKENEDGTKTEETEEDIRSISNRFTEEDCRLIEEEGISLEKYNIERLERVLNRIKESKVFKEENIERISQEREQNNRDIQKIAFKNKIRNVASGNMEQQIANYLEGTGLPATTENIEKIANAVHMAKVVPRFSEKAVGYMIHQELTPTIENMYQAQYAGVGSQYANQAYAASGYEVAVSNEAVSYEKYQSSSSNQKRILDDQWKQLKPQVEKMIENKGLQVDETILDKAKWLFQNGLPITAESIEQLQQIEEAKQTFNLHTILRNIVNSFAKGEAPEQAIVIPQTHYSKQSVESFLTEINQQLEEMSHQGITKEWIEEVLPQENSVHEIEEEINTKNPLQASVASDQVIADITRYRQLEEIRLKMTVESANRLAEKGIKLDISGLHKIVEGLREIEEQYYRNVLEESNLVVDDNNVEILKETTDKINQLKETPSYVLGVTFEQRKTINVSQLHQQAVNLKQRLEKASETYDTLMTEPRRDLGDSIKKAFRNINEILEDMGLEQTQANQRAVKILGYNRMPITEENIIHMKEYDTQVNNLMNKLHPGVTVEMIRKGTNPLEVSITELNQQIEEIKQDLGISQEEKYSRYLWKLEQNHQISPEERDTFIGIYRLLNNVEKSDGAAIGHVLQANQEVTLKNLFTAVKTINAGNINLTMEQDTGLSEVSFSREPLLQQLEKDFILQEERNQAANKMPNEIVQEQEETTSNTSEEPLGGTYIDQVITALYDEISPKKLHQVVTNMETDIEMSISEKMDQLMNCSVERLLEEIRNQTKVAKRNESLQEVENIEIAEEEQSQYEKEFLRNLQSLKEDAKQAIEFLTAKQLPVNVKNLMSTQQLLGDNSIFKKWKEEIKELPEADQMEAEGILDDFSDALETEDDMMKQYDRLNDITQEILNHKYSQNNITSSELLEWKNFARGMEFIQSLSQRRSYEIPISTGESITNLHVTIISEKDSLGKVEVTVHSEKLGKMQSIFTIKEQVVNGYVLGDKKDSMEALEEMKTQWKAGLLEEGITIKEIHYQTIDREAVSNKRMSLKNQEEATETKTLYKIAKTFVQQVKELERGTYYEN